jgi:hypothetical protein
MTILVGTMSPEVGCFTVVHGFAAAQGELAATVGTYGFFGGIGGGSYFFSIICLC